MSDEMNTGIEDTGADSGAGSEAQNLQDLFELVEGKNSDGTPIKKQLTRAEMLELAQKGFGADKAFEEVAMTKKQLKEFAAAARDPERVFDLLQQLGHDTDKLLTGRLNKQMLEALKTPEEVEIEQLRRDAEAYRKSEAKRLRDEEERQIGETANATMTKVYSTIEGVLSASGVDQSKETVAEVARYLKQMMTSAERQGKDFRLEDVPLDGIIEHLQERRNSFFSWLDELDDDRLLQTLGDKRQKRISAALTKLMSGKQMNSEINKFERKNTVPETEGKQKKVLSVQEVEELNAKRIAKMQEAWERTQRK